MGKISAQPHTTCGNFTESCKISMMQNRTETANIVGIVVCCVLNLERFILVRVVRENPLDFIFLWIALVPQSFAETGVVFSKYDKY